MLKFGYKWFSLGVGFQIVKNRLQMVKNRLQIVKFRLKVHLGVTLEVVKFRC